METRFLHKPEPSAKDALRKWSKSPLAKISPVALSRSIDLFRARLKMQSGHYHGVLTLRSLQVDVVFYSEISAEIRTRQDTDRYLSTLWVLEDKEGVFELVLSLERYRRIEWAAEMIRSYPEKSWQTVLHNRC
jgi:hypothetical protein